MRITKKSSSNLSIAQVISKLNKRQSLTNQYESGNKNEKQKSFLLEKESLMNGEPIKVQLSKNNPNKKIYSTKTIDYKTFYNKGFLPNTNNNDTYSINNNIPISKKSSNNIQRQNFKIATETNDENLYEQNAINNKNGKNNDIGNIDRLKKYLIPRNNNQNPIRNSSNLNRPRVISASPIPSNPYLKKEEEEEEENNNVRQTNHQQTHKIRELLSQKFTYNKPKTTSTPNNIKKKPHPYDLKTYCNNNRSNLNNDNINVNSFNCNKKEQIQKNKDNLSMASFEDSPYNMNNYNNYNFRPEIKLDDLIIYDERLNDILVALNNKNEPDASNECAEFFVFYFHSSLQKIFTSFFNVKHKIIIESATNLAFLAIIITYHLSLLRDILREITDMVINIFSLLKINLYLNVKKIQIVYGDDFVEKNNFYFKTFNYYLRTQNLISLKEDEIVFKIDHNCRLITNDIKKILKIYQQINNSYYSDFIAIFNNISIISEKDLKDYFYARLYGFMNNKTTDNKNLSNSKNRKISITKGGKKNNNKNYNINNGNESDYNNENNLDNADVISVKSSKSSHYYGKIDKHNFKILKLLEEYEKNKIEAPFIKTPCKKKYSIVLDLDETLINIEFKGVDSKKCTLHFRLHLQVLQKNMPSLLLMKSN